MLKDLRDLIAIRSHCFKSNECLVNPQSIINDVIDQYRFELKTKNINMSAALDNVNRSIFLDKERFTQVFTALFSNAIKFTDHGEITVEAKIRLNSETVSNNSLQASALKNNGYVLFVQVKDSGCGMTHKVRKNLFKPFGLDGSSSSRAGGFSQPDALC